MSSNTVGYVFTPPALSCSSQPPEPVTSHLHSEQLRLYSPNCFSVDGSFEDIGSVSISVVRVQERPIFIKAQGPSSHSQTSVSEEQRVTRSHPRPKKLTLVCWSPQVKSAAGPKTTLREICRSERQPGHGLRPEASQAEAPGFEARHCPLARDAYHPSHLTYWEKYWRRWAGAGCQGDCVLTPSPKAAAPPQLPRKLATCCAERKARRRGPHLILQRLSSSCLSTPPPPHSSLAREQDGSCPQEIKIPNGSISCQALSPATKVDSVPAKSPQAFSHPFVSLVRYPH